MRSWNSQSLQVADGNLPGAKQQDLLRSRAGRSGVVYLRAAQAYMLISMPTDTSAIFGVFQVIRVSQVVWRDVRAART
jgi:hypothetical protein